MGITSRQINIKHNIRGFHSSEESHCSLLRYDSSDSGRRESTFWMNFLLPRTGVTPVGKCSSHESVNDATFRLYRTKWLDDSCEERHRIYKETSMV
jgi:hypothetical protein